MTFSIVRGPDRTVIRQAVRLHRAALGWSWIVSLGERFLEPLYESLLEARTGFLVVAKDGDRLLGFILGSTEGDRLMSVVLRRPQRFAGAVVLALIRRPGLIVRMLETLSYGRKTHRDARAELVVIAVESDVRSRGYGRELVASLEAELKARGIDAYRVTVHAAMTRANEFYVRNGFRLAQTFRLYGQPWNLYVRGLASGEAVRG